MAEAGKWASCLRLINPFSGETLKLIELDHDQVALGMTLCRFLSHSPELLLVVGTARALQVAPRTSTMGSLQVYRFINNGSDLELLHEVTFFYVVLIFIDGN